MRSGNASRYMANCQNNLMSKRSVKWPKFILRNYNNLILLNLSSMEFIWVKEDERDFELKREKKTYTTIDRSFEWFIKSSCKMHIHILWFFAWLFFFYKMQLFHILEHLLIIQNLMAASKRKKKQWKKTPPKWWFELVWNWRLLCAAHNT